jgi:hypothetical protein
MSSPTVTQELVLLRGASILHAETLLEIATLGDDGRWRTPEGAITDSIGIPHPAAKAIVKPDAARAAHKAQDAVWLKQALAVLEELATRQKEVTVDDCWTHMAMPPRKPSLMSTLMVAAGRDGVIEKTTRHRRSIRPINGGRTVRVWRSLIYSADHLAHQSEREPAAAASRIEVEE